ncbi:Panacea domain-containing protein [Arenimonas sp.]|uniref:Panacea domain-containing protein n=1 Tax=Arenimonas sp. TaxID=1872635 RepID=UPI0035ADD2E0
MRGHATAPTRALDVYKATAVVAFLVQGTGESMYPVMKMLYLADKLHLERYGRFIVGDSYAAMKEGPVPRGTYDLMKHVRGEPQAIPGADHARTVLAYEPNHQLRLLADPDLEQLSDSEVECVSEVIELYKSFGKWGIRDLSHDDAWRAAWRKRIFAKSIPMEIESIASELQNASELLEHLRDPQPGSA